MYMYVYLYMYVCKIYKIVFFSACWTPVMILQAWEFTEAMVTISLILAIVTFTQGKWLCFIQYCNFRPGPQSVSYPFPDHATRRAPYQSLACLGHS